jgi:hypothetical protein
MDLPINWFEEMMFGSCSKMHVMRKIVLSLVLYWQFQLRYLAYAAFTSAKHGHLGKKKRIPLPNCVVSGIRDVYPDVDNEYVGFKPAEVNDK